MQLHVTPGDSLDLFYLLSHTSLSLCTYTDFFPIKITEPLNNGGLDQEPVGSPLMGRIPLVIGYLVIEFLKIGYSAIG